MRRPNQYTQEIEIDERDLFLLEEEEEDWKELEIEKRYFGMGSLIPNVRSITIKYPS